MHALRMPEEHVQAELGTLHLNARLEAVPMLAAAPRRSDVSMQSAHGRCGMAWAVASRLKFVHAACLHIDYMQYCDFDCRKEVSHREHSAQRVVTTTEQAHAEVSSDP